MPNGWVNVGDVIRFNPAFGARPGSPAWSQRLDLDQNSLINVGDILKLNPYMNQSCSTHYGLTFRGSDVTSNDTHTAIQHCDVIGGIPWCVPYAVVTWNIQSFVQGFEENTYVGQTFFQHSIYIYDYYNDDPFVGYSVVPTVNDELCPGLCQPDGTVEVCDTITKPEDLIYCRESRDPFVWVDPLYQTVGTLFGLSQQGFQVIPGQTNSITLGNTMVP